MRTRALLALLLAGSALPARGQEEAPPVFAAEVDLVAVDVNVVDRNGRPVRSLAPGDFTLTVDRRPRRIVSLEYVDLGEEAEGREAPPSSPYFSTNEGLPPGRLVLFVVDQANIRLGGARAVVAAADRVLDRLNPADRTGLVTIPAPGPSVEFTGLHAQVREALMKVSGRGQFEGRRVGLVEAVAFVDNNRLRWGDVLDRECGHITGDAERQMCIRDLEGEAWELATDFRGQSQAAVKALGGVFDALGDIEGPKTVILITEGMTDSQGGTIVWRDLAAQAASARVSLYVLRLGTGGAFVDASRARPSPTALEDDHFRRDGVETLAALARGAVFNVAGTGDEIYDRISRELTGYYLIGFEPEAGDRDGRDHSIAVEVARRGLTVRSRGSVNIPTGPPSEPTVLAAMMRAPFLATDLLVRVSAYTLADAEGRARVLVSAEVERGRGAVAVGFALLDAKGRMLGTGADRIEPPSGPDRVAYLGSAVVDPGTYTLKVVAVDSVGRRGSVEHPVKAAPVSAGGLELSDLVVGPPGVQGSRFVPSAGLGVGGALVARVEMRAKDRARLEKATMVVEVAESEQGPVIETVPATAADAPDGRRVAQAGLALGVLPPGDYHLRAVVSVDGERVAGLSRPVRLATSAPPSGRAAAIPAASLAASVGAFDLAAVLAPDVVGYFLDRMAALVPGDVSPPVASAIGRARSGDAAGILEILGPSGPEEPRILFLRAIGQLAHGETAAAGNHLRAALRLASDFLPAAFYLGACYAAGGEDRHAAGAWQTALVTETGHPAVYRLLADSLLRVGEGPQALAVAQEALEEWPGDEGLARRVGFARALAGQRDEALAALTPYVERHPDDAGAVFVMLRLLFDAFREDAAATPPAERERMLRYAKSYVDNNGPSQQLVARWLRYLEEDRP